MTYGQGGGVYGSGRGVYGSLYVPDTGARKPKTYGLAPEYRYFTVDLMTNEILAEVPFRGVSYECALKAGGKFSGRIPLTAETDSMDLYNSTMPGNTALFIVRNGVCVWGGIIWARNYQFSSRDLAISASEFTSYFYHRKIWKTFNHQFGGTVTYTGAESQIWTQTRINFATNPWPTASGSTDNWLSRFSWTLTRDGSYAIFTNPTAGSASGRGYDIFGNYDLASPGTVTPWLTVPVRAGDQVTVSVLSTVSNGASVRINARMHDGAGNWLTTSGAMNGTYQSMVSGVEKRHAETFVAGYNGYIVFRVELNTATFAVGDTIKGRQMLIEKAATAGTYFDGNSGSGTNYRHSWAGTPYASASYHEDATIPNSGWTVILDNGSDVLPRGGSTVKLEFYEPDNFKYNGYYRVNFLPAPNSKRFSIVGGYAVADLVSAETQNLTWIVFRTKENHGYSDGDSVTITVTTENGVVNGSPRVITALVDAPDGPESNYFRILYAGTGWNTTLIPVDGTTARTLPAGTYEDVTVTVRQDAFDYIRTLIDATFADFVGTDFPNVYIEPGISWSLPVISKQAINGYAIVQTSEPHNIAPGQAIQVQDVDGIFDGEYEVTDTPAPDVLVYAQGGNYPLTTVAPIVTTITTVQMSEGVATLTTLAAHGLSVGQNVTIDIGDPYGDFSGTFEITAVPSTTTFKYDTGIATSYSSTTLSYASTTVAGDPVNEVTRVGVASNVVTLELKDPLVYSVGDSVVVANVNRDLQIAEKSLDAPNSKATVKTIVDHGLSVGDTVSISGLVDTASIISKTTTTSSVTMTTERPHNFRIGDSVTIRGTDLHKITNKVLYNNVATLTTAVNHNVSVGALISVIDLYDNATPISRGMLNNVATLTTAGPHNFQINDMITVSGLTDTYSVVSKEVVGGVVTLTTSIPHNILVGSKLTVSGVGVPFDGTEITVDSVTATRVTYKIDSKYWDEQKTAAARAGQNLYIPTDVPSSKAAGTITNTNSFYNGQFVVTAVTVNTVQFALSGEDQPTVTATGTNMNISAPSVFNGTYTVTARTNTTLSYARAARDVGSTAVPLAVNTEDVQPVISLNTIHDGAQTVTSITPNTFTFSQVMPSATTQAVVLEARKASIFNGTRTITEVPTTDRFAFALTGYSANVYEANESSPSYARATAIYNGTFTITAVDAVQNTISYAKTLQNYGSVPVLSRGRASVNPVVTISSFGPFPGNADIGMYYSYRGYTGINLEPAMYRGFELKSVGDALDSYSDNINGFEYRIDCAYDAETDSFTKTFVMLPINFPDPPATGEVAPISRYGADKLIFEYPGGNITEVTLDESAEEAATRFFATGETDLGADAGFNIGVASSQDLLTGKDGRIWPLLDASEQISGVDDKNELYAYAQRYLSEASPPYTRLSVELNGSIAPFVGDYKAGDWCSLILRDPFADMRLQSDLEPRKDVVVRKISSYEVRVPDGVTFPETVTLTLVAEWEVDKRGQ